MTSETISTDGLLMVRIPLHSIMFPPDGPTSIKGIEDRVRHEPERSLMRKFRETVERGGRLGVPVVYMNAKGRLLVSDVRDSDLILYAEKFVLPGNHVPAGDVAMIHAKIIEVTDKHDIPAKRSAYMADRPEPYRPTVTVTKPETKKPDVQQVQLDPVIDRAVIKASSRMVSSGLAVLPNLPDKETDK